MTDIEKDIKELHGIVEEQQKQIDSQAELINELEQECTIRDSRINSITRSLDSIEERIKLIGVGTKAIQLSPIEEALVYYDLPYECDIINKKSAERAAQIVKNYHNWSIKTKGGGRRLSVQEDNLIKLYESKYGEKLQSTQIRRSFEVAASLSRGKLVFRKNNGNQLDLLPDQVLITTKEQLEEMKKAD